MTAVFLLGLFGVFMLPEDSPAWALCIILTIVGSVGLGTWPRRG